MRFSLLFLALLLSGCTSATEKTPTGNNTKSLFSEPMGDSFSSKSDVQGSMFGVSDASISAALMPAAFALTNKPTSFNVPTGAPIGIQNTNWPLYHVVWSASPTPGVVYQVWKTSTINGPFYLAGTTSSTTFPFSATNVQGYFKVRAIGTDGVLSPFAK
jgi:hypothetical protein